MPLITKIGPFNLLEYLELVKDNVKPIIKDSIKEIIREEGITNNYYSNALFSIALLASGAGIGYYIKYYIDESNKNEQTPLPTNKIGIFY